MEKETLEKAAYQARRDYQDEFGKDGMNECIMFDAMKIQKGFQLGAKWQAEKMYSEEEKELMIKIFHSYWFENNPEHEDNLKEWELSKKLFEQFKK